MIVVDTSVWVDLLNGNNSPQVTQCTALIEQGAPVALTDIILTEVLQGFRSESEARKVQRRLMYFPIVRLEEIDDFLRAAALYRKARRAGITIRKTLDCLIAATCLRAEASLLHADRDFDLLATVSPLQIHA